MALFSYLIMTVLKIYKMSKDLLKLASEEILFNNNEKEIFSLLMNVVKEKSPNTVLRIAGGFVRDKLLGKESNDIDIAVNNMSGEDFANLVVEYMREKGLATRGVALIEANPEKSKHLATATVKVLGTPIDFVNLRKEDYSSDSRVPTISEATPEEDASRRDLTINALFYNINESKIEDFVGGKEDLKNRIARTPIDSVKTFLDDPLRILRTIRFAAKYNLELSPELIEAAKLPEVKEAFRNKLTAERIWTELAGKKEGDKNKPGALSGENPHRAVQLLSQLGLRDLIFELSDEDKKSLGLEDEFVPFETDQNNSHHDLNIWDHTMEVLRNLVEQTKDNTKKDVENYLVRNIAAILHDYGKRYKGLQSTNEKGDTSYHGHEKLSADIAEKILVKLRAPNDIISKVKVLVENHMRPHVLTKDDTSDKSLRKYISEMGDSYRDSIELAKADSLGKANKDKSIAEKYDKLLERLDNLKSQTGGTSIKRPITGNDLIQLGLKPGKELGLLLKRLDDALLENPFITKDEAIDMIKQWL